MDLLKRELAPITDAAWKALRQEASRSLRTNLSARRVADVDGPKGLGFAAVGLGRLEVADCSTGDGMCYGVHRVLPLVEVRAPFELNVWELDNIERGAKDIDYAPVYKAARGVAAFEEKAVYQGFAPGNIVGMSQAAGGRLTLGLDVSKYPDAAARALLELRNKEIDGPYALVLGHRPFQVVQGTYSAYPPRKQIEQLIGGPIIYSPFIEGGFLVSTRGGDLELTLGQDLSLGYETHDTKKVRLYLTESFTFRVLEPAAIVELTLG